MATSKIKFRSSTDVNQQKTNFYLEDCLFVFMEQTAISLKEAGKIRTSESYISTLNSFRRFRENKDLTLSAIDSSIIIAYEEYLKKNGVTPNSSSFYMRNLRAVYNRAVEKQLIIQQYPFKHVYTGVDKTIKRAVSISVIKKIKQFLESSPERLKRLIYYYTYIVYFL